MNKSDLIKLTSKKSGMSKSETTGVINSMIEVIGETIQNGDKVNYFWHENDLGTLTSKGYIWSTNLFDRGILVMPEIFNKEPMTSTLGVCSDYIEKYK